LENLVVSADGRDLSVGKDREVKEQGAGVGNSVAAAKSRVELTGGGKARQKSARFRLPADDKFAVGLSSDIPARDEIGDRLFDDSIRAKGFIEVAFGIEPFEPQDFFAGLRCGSGEDKFPIRLGRNAHRDASPSRRRKQ